jgi:hypothetical protein
MKAIRAVAALVSILASMVLSEISSVQAARRVALVIGNSDYKSAPRLENPKNDATDLAAVLEGLGFQVTKGLDLDKIGMERTIREFAEALPGANAALFFYAGHGLQVGGQNYLVPTDARLATAAALDFELIRLDLIHRTMEREVSTNILFLDACRDNPLSRNLARALGTRSMQVGRGLAGVESGEGTLISFSTQPGNVALDGTGRNSPFASALLTHIRTPQQDLQSILINVRKEVMTATERRQVPWEHSAMTARFFFSEPASSEASSSNGSAGQDVEVAVWDSVKDSSDPAVLRTYLKKFPAGAFAAVARNLIAALEKQEELETAASHTKAKQEEELRKAQENELQKAREELRKARDAAKSAGTEKTGAARGNTSARSSQDGAAQAKTGGGFRTCGRNGCQWVPAGCRAVPNSGGGGLGGKIFCP